MSGWESRTATCNCRSVQPMLPLSNAPAPCRSTIGICLPPQQAVRCKLKSVHVGHNTALPAESLTGMGLHCAPLRVISYLA